MRTLFGDVVEASRDIILYSHPEEEEQGVAPALLIALIHRSAWKHRIAAPR
jgi:hypothetical protein